MFEIKFLDKYDEESSRYGEIKIGSFEDTFLSSPDYWAWQQYEGQWKDGIKRILNGDNKSCLITDINDPSTAKYIFWRPIYLLDERVIFQEQVLFLDRLQVPFNENDPYLSVSNRIKVNDEGDQVSEWETDLKSLEIFYNKVLS